MKKILFFGAALSFIICSFFINISDSLAETSEVVNSETATTNQNVDIKIPKLPVDSTETVDRFITPPPAYIQTHQVQPVPPETVPTTIDQDDDNVSATTSLAPPTTLVTETNLPAPPTIVPQELPEGQGEVTQDFVVTSVVVVETKTNVETNSPTARVIEFQGRAKPNTYITLYIYSTPIIVTVKTDSQGNWKYNLDQELEDGVHRIYVAQIDNTGSVVAKSDPIFFTKAAASVQIVASGVLPGTSAKVNFFQRYYAGIALIVLAVAILIGLTVIGLAKNKSTDIPSEPSNDIQ